MQSELKIIMGGGASAVPSAPRAVPTIEEPTVPRRRGRPPGRRKVRSPHPLRGKKRPESASGPLAPAVVSVIKKAGKPLAVNDILKGLAQANYEWTCADPKKNLYARIYRLKGVRRVKEGVFGLA